MLVFSEIFPKTVAAMHPEKVGLFSSHILVLLLKIFYPLVWLMNIFTKTLMRMVGLKPDMQKQVISREELRSIVSEAGERGLQDMERLNALVESIRNMSAELASVVNHE